MDENNRLNELEVRVAVMETVVDAHKSALEKNTDAIEKFTAVFNQAKGTKIILVGICIFVAFLADLGFRIFGK